MIVSGAPTLPDIFMLIIAVIGGAAALLVVTSRNVVHAALYLVVVLAGSAGAPFAVYVKAKFMSNE